MTDAFVFGTDAYTVSRTGNTSGTHRWYTSSGLSLLLAAGDLRPGADDSFDLGTASARFSDIYATNPVISTSDQFLKFGIRVVNAAEKRVAAALQASSRIYQWIDAVEAKGEEVARLHCGFIAQDVEAAFDAEGLDAGRYSLFTRTPITKTVTKTREVEQQVTETVTSDVMEIEVVDGVAVQKLVSKTTEQGVTTTLPLVDEAGDPVMHQIKVGMTDEVTIGATTFPPEPIFEDQQLTHRIPVMETVSEDYEVEEPDGDRLGLRYAELMCFLMAAT